MIAALTTPALREELGRLCAHVENLRSWWEAQNDVIRMALGTLTTSRIHDHFIEGVISARIIARAAGIEIDRARIGQQDWNALGPSLREPVVGPAPTATYLGRSFGPAGAGQKFSTHATLTNQEFHEQLGHLCEHVEYLLSWWEAQNSVIRTALGERTTSRVYDHFIDAAMGARTIAGAAGVEVDRALIDQKDWHAPDPLPQAPAVGPAPALTYLGGNLGLEDAARVSIFTKTPTGKIELPLELALRHIDEYAEPGRTRILLCLPFYYNFDEVTA